MEYRLNKIDPEVRQRIKEITKPGKVHNKSDIAINKDNKDEKERENSGFNSKLEKQKNKKGKKIFSVDAVKADEVQVPAYKEKTEIFSKDETKGSIIDVKK